ncbi:MAG TPA: hypothetical protein VED37_02495 [Ktedonobacteraceae bacterium]|nr:hypothetical protein [Ktedonobacteraceae bacterium]
MAHKQYRWLEERDERWNDIQIVHQGEVFPLLLLSRNGTTTRIDDNGLFGGIASRIRLQMGPLDTLNISVAGAPYVMQKGSVLAPFERSKGYPLDQEDFSLQSRIKKIIRLKNEMAESIEGLGLVIFASYDDLPLHSQLRLNPENNATFLSPEIVSLLERVFLTLTFPGGASFSARAIYTSGRLFLLFRTFFPTDTGPLPVPKTLPEEIHHLSVEEGFRILLPFDIDQVQTIRAKFLLLPGTGE